MVWMLVVLFIAAQNLQVAIYGWAFERSSADASTVDRMVATFKEPAFLASLLLLSMATAALRLGLFPTAGIARTHIVTSTAVVLSFGLFALVFGESQGASRYAGAVLCGVGIYLVAR